MSGDRPGDPDFLARRAAARRKLDAAPGAFSDDPAGRKAWFSTVYNFAEGDPAAVPWADLAAKPALVDWLLTHPGRGRRALDVGCGLGDNAEALAAAGWLTSAFDVAEGAVAWARRRFPDTSVDYRCVDLFEPPAEWLDGFDLVHECFTLQAMAGPMRAAAFNAVARLVAPGGTLLVIARTRTESEPVGQPPWPLAPSELARFEALGFVRVGEHPYASVSARGVAALEARLEFSRA